MNKLAVIGHPVGHSRSPAMHNAALAELGLADEWSYEAIDIPPDAFDRRLREMAAAEFVGANVTVPHKGAALAAADTLAETAREIGAANTLSFAEGGEIRADNTDAPGLLEALPRSPRGARAGPRCRRGSAGRGLGAAARGDRGRGLEPDRAALDPPVRGARRDIGGLARSGRLRPDRQLDLGRAGGRGPLRRAAASPGRV